jgi:foldase protein PrsA
MLFSLYSLSPVKLTRLQKLTSLAALACALVLVTAACGGGDDAAAEEPPPPAETTPPEPAEPEPPAPAPTEPAEEPALAEPSGGDPKPPPATPPGDVEVPTPTTVPAGAIAVVGEVAIDKSAFDLVIGQRKTQTVNSGGEFPAVGTEDYEAIKNQMVDFLVQRQQYVQEAAALGVEITDEDVEARLDELKQQFFEGDDERYQEELANQGLTEEQIVDDLRFQLLTDALFARVTEAIVIDDAEVSTYYTENQESFIRPEQREVAHILVETKEEADDVRAAVNDGEDFAELAAEHSIDTGTAVNGGAYTAVKGLSVPEFDEAAYALETDAVSDPVESQFGWHIIKALEDIEPSGLQTLDEVRGQIDGLIRTEREAQVVEAWLLALEAKYDGKVIYAIGFEPPPSEDLEPAAEESTP